MIKVVVFDWNGTIIADTEAVREADNFLIKKFGGRTPSYYEYISTQSDSSIGFYLHYGCKEKKLVSNIQLAGELQHNFYEKRAAKCRSRKGAKELLKWINKMNVESIILSNHTKDSINLHLKRLTLNEYVSHVFAHNLKEGFLKPHNKLKKLKHFMKLHKVNQNEVAVIGDSPEEIYAGNKLGMYTIAITGGCHSKHKLKKAKPNKIVGNLKECIKILKKI